MIEYIALGGNILTIAICFILHNKQRVLKDKINEEIATRQEKDDKLFNLINSQFKTIMEENSKTIEEIRKLKIPYRQQPQQYSPPQQYQPPRPAYQQYSPQQTDVEEPDPF